MLDTYTRQLIDPALNAIARVLVKLRITANMLTVVGFGFGCVCFGALAFEYYSIAFAFLLLNRVMDGLDGALARQTQATDFGGYLDIVLDFIFYAGAIFFFAVGRVDMALPAAFLIFAFMGTGSSFLAYAIMAAKQGVNHERQGKKSFYYLHGITEGTETIILIGLICLLPHYFAVLAYGYGALCWITTFGRMMQAKADFNNP